VQASSRSETTWVATWKSHRKPHERSAGTPRTPARARKPGVIRKPSSHWAQKGCRGRFSERPRQGASGPPAPGRKTCRPLGHESGATEGPRPPARPSSRPARTAHGSRAGNVEGPLIEKPLRRCPSCVRGTGLPCGGPLPSWEKTTTARVRSRRQPRRFRTVKKHLNMFQQSGPNCSVLGGPAGVG